VDDRIEKLQRDLRLFKRYVVGLTLGLGAMTLAAFQQSGRTRFTEIDVERINIVEKDGTKRLAIANSTRIAPITFYGKEYPRSRRPGANDRAGMTFFNDEGTENGGLGWSGKRMPDGEFSAMGGLTFDQYNQDEAVAVAYIDENGRRWAGLAVFDHPETSMQPYLDSLMVFRVIADSAERARRTQAYQKAVRERGEGRRQRLFAGKEITKSSVLTLADPQGRQRLRLSVDSLGKARIEFLDENGKVTDALSGKK